MKNAKIKIIKNTPKKPTKKMFLKLIELEKKYKTSDKKTKKQIDSFKYSLRKLNRKKTKKYLFHAKTQVKQKLDLDLYNLKDSIFYLKLDIRHKRRNIKNNFNIETTKYKNFTIRKIGGLFIKDKKEILKEMHKSSFYKSKKPVSMQKHIGVEIEFLSELSEDCLAEKIYAEKPYLHKYIEIKDDVSVKNLDCECGNNSYNYDCECLDEYRYNNCECLDEYRENNCQCLDEHRENNCQCLDEYRENNCECLDEYRENNCECLENECNCEKHYECNCHEYYECNCAEYYVCNCAEYYECNCAEFYECNCEKNCECLKGLEISICASEKKYQKIIKDLCTILQEIGEINKTCGIHIHIDCRKRNAKKVYSNLVSSQKFIYALNPVSRLKNRFCLPNDSKTLQKRTYDRYKCINGGSFNIYKTIEIRAHSGSLNPEKIINFTELLIKISDQKLIKTFPKTLKSISKKIKLNPFQEKYFEKRLLKFKTAHIQHNIFYNDFLQKKINKTKLKKAA